MTSKEKIDDLLEILSVSKTLFTEFERKFVKSVHQQIESGRTLSNKQTETINSIYTKFCEA